MIRTIFVAAWVILFFIFSFIFLVPLVFFMGKEKGIRFSRKLAKYWGKSIIDKTGSSVEFFYKNREIIESLKDEPVVIVSNHQSNMDIPVLLGYFPKDMGFVAKKEMETWPAIGGWMKKIQCVFLDRNNPRAGIKTMQEAVEKIKNGYSVVIFPEGTRSKTGEIGEFKKGSFKLASDSGVKIIPVSIKGTMEIMGKESGKIVKSSVKVFVDEPIDPLKLEKEELKSLNEKVRNVIVENYNSL